MAVGDDVEVEVLGEQLPRVARIEALWSERPVDGTERMLARCRFYYRPQVHPTLLHTRRHAPALGLGIMAKELPNFRVLFWQPSTSC